MPCIEGAAATFSAGERGFFLILERTDKYPGRPRVRQVGAWGASLLCSAVLFLGGCVVSKGTYETAVADMEAARTELEKSRMRHATLQEENAKLRADHQQAAFDLEMLGAEIQQIKEGQAGELDLLASREAALQRDREAMVDKLRAVQEVHQKLKSQNRALRDTVRRYQQELEEARKAAVKKTASARKNVKPKRGAPEIPSPGGKKHSPEASRPAGTPFDRTAAPEGSSPGAPPLVATKSSPKPVPPPVAVPFNGTATPVNINTASANDLELFLGLTKEVADKVVLNRPYRLRGELLSKKVLPKATFDVIKDRITAAPQ